MSKLKTPTRPAAWFPKFVCVNIKWLIIIKSSPLQISTTGSLLAWMLSIVPHSKQIEHKAELIFVIDRSDSMNGTGIQQAKKALLVNHLQFELHSSIYCKILFKSQLFLHSLPSNCYVNIAGFGSKYHLLFPVASRKYDDEVLTLTKEYAEGNFSSICLFKL